MKNPHADCDACDHDLAFCKEHQVVWCRRCDKEWIDARSLWRDPLPAIPAIPPIAPLPYPSHWQPAPWQPTIIMTDTTAAPPGFSDRGHTVCAGGR